MRSDVTQVLDRYNSLQLDIKSTEASVSVTELKLQDLLAEQETSEKAKVVIGSVKGLLSSSSVSQLIDLFNAALHAIFDKPDSYIAWNIESSRLELIDVNQDGSQLVTDLTESNGGGLATVISTVADIFLLVKNGSRRLLVYDEHWTAVSSCYFDKFIDFIRQACKDLNIDILLVSHDDRLTPEMVDHVYQIKDGKSIKVK